MGYQYAHPNRQEYNRRVALLFQGVEAEMKNASNIYYENYNRPMNLNSTEQAAREFYEAAHSFWGKTYELNGNTVYSPKNKFTYIFNKCDGTSCIIIVDINGDDKPNKISTKEMMHDRLLFKLITVNGRNVIYAPTWYNEAKSKDVKANSSSTKTSNIANKYSARSRNSEEYHMRYSSNSLNNKNW